MEDRRSKYDEVFKRMWEAVENEVGKTRVAKAEIREEERERRKKVRRERIEEGIKRRINQKRREQWKWKK